MIDWFKKYAPILGALQLSYYLPVSAEHLPAELKYSFRHIDVDRTPYFDVILEFKGSEEGTTKINLPVEWAGQKELYQEIRELRCLSSQCRLEETDNPSVKIVHHQPNEIIQITYKIVALEKNGSQWYHRPIIRDNFFFILGHSLFILPESNHRDAQVLLEWHDFPLNWKLANSFGQDEKNQDVVLKYDTLLDAIYVGGDFRILKCGKESSPIFIALRGKWSFSDEWLIKVVETILDSQRAFWNDFDFPYYFITILASENEYSWGGTGVKNAFFVFYPDFSEDDTKACNSFLHLISHEHFHIWNGQKLASEAPKGIFKWFSEGFTDYYAVTLNYRTGLISFLDYINYINEVLHDYHVSPALNTTNEQILECYWNNRSCKKIPYLRGFVFALMWDKKIRDATKNRHSLDDIMRALFKKMQQEQRSFSMEDVEQIASNFLLPETVKKDLENYIINGETLIPDRNLFALE